MRVLVIEDERRLNRLVCERLAKAGYGVDSCADGAEAQSFLRSAQYDCVVLDIMLPGKNGLDILREARAGGMNSPVIALTARGGVDDRVAGLDAGADDYLPKPFAMDELLARVRALIRRSNNGASDIIEVGGLAIDCAARTASRAGAALELSNKEFSILEFLARNAGAVVSREKIRVHVWNYDYEGESNIVDVYIRYLRRKIDDPHTRKLIHTVRGAGFVLREEN